MEEIKHCMWKEILEKIEMEESAREEYFSDKEKGDCLIFLKLFCA